MKKLISSIFVLLILISNLYAEILVSPITVDTKSIDATIEGDDVVFNIIETKQLKYNKQERLEEINNSIEEIEQLKISYIKNFNDSLVELNEEKNMILNAK